MQRQAKAGRQVRGECLWSALDDDVVDDDDDGGGGSCEKYYYY